MSLPYLRGVRGFFFSNDLVGHLEDDFREIQGPEKRIRQRFFFLERRFYAPISGEIEPVLEDRSGTDFLPETGFFFRYDYFDGFSGRRMFVPDVF